MYQIGEYVIHMTGGICKVTAITPLDIPGADKNRQYYLLVPIKASGSKVYVPTDNDTAMRKISTSDEALGLIKDFPSIEETSIENEKMREARYKEAIKSCDLHELAGVIKNLAGRRAKRLEEGKKNTATDDKYFKIAEDNLLSELAFVLGKEKKEVKEILVATLHA